MSEDTTRVAGLEFNVDSNVDKATDAFENFAAIIKEQMGLAEKFSTEVTDFESALALSFEEPRQNFERFSSLMLIGVDQMRQGWDSLPEGARTFSFALEEISNRIPALNRFVPTFQSIGRVAEQASGYFSRIRNQLKGMAGHWENVSKLAFQMTTTIRDQGRAQKILHDQELADMRTRMSDIKAYIVLQEKIDVLQEKIALREKGKKSATEAQAASLARMKSQLDSYGLGVENVAQAQSLLAETSEKYNIQLRVIGPLMTVARGHLSTLATDIRHMSSGMITNGKVAEQRFRDAQLQIEAYQTQVSRLRKLGVDVPEELEESFRRASAVMGTFEQQIRKQEGKAAGASKAIWERARELFSGTSKQAKDAGEKIGKAAGGVRKWASSLNDAAQSNKMLMQYVAPQGIVNQGLQHVGANITRGTAAAQNLSLSLGSIVGVAGAVGGALGQIDPAFSTLIVGASQLGDQFVRSFTAMMAISGTAADKIKAAMGIISNSLLGFGLAATGIIVKSGLLGAEVKTLEITMRQVAKNIAGEAGVDIDKFADYVENLRDQVIETGITTRQATNAMTQFLRARLPTDQVLNLANAAKNLGVTVADMSSSEVFGRFIEFVSTGNSGLLDAVNITTTAARMLDDYAKENDLVVQSMTPMQKQLAYINGLMKETATVTGVYEEAMKSAGKQLSSMKRLFEEAILTIGERAEPILAKLIVGMNKLLKWFNALPDEVHDNIFAAIKWASVMGTLLGIVLSMGPALRAIVPVIKLLGRSILTSMPWMIALSAAIGGIVLVVRGFKKLWDQNWNDIQGSVSLLVNTLRTEFAPLIDLIKVGLKFLADDLKSVLTTITTGLQSATTRLSEIVMSIKDRLGPVFTTLKLIVFGFVMFVHNMFQALNSYLRGDTDQAEKYVTKAFRNIVTVARIIFQRLIQAALEWGKGFAINLATGIWNTAKTVVVQVMTAIGNLIGRFLKPGSPPKEGPLRHIVKWASGVMTTYLRGFEKADFGVLRDVVAPIQQALKSAVSAKTIDEKESKNIFKNVRQNVALLLSDFRKTGKINEQVLGDISKKLGEGGKEYVEYIRRTLQYQQALKNLEDVRADVAEAEAAGFVSKDLKDRLKAAEAEVEKRKDAVEWQKEFLAAMQETVDLQEELAEKLDKVGKAIEKLADTEFKLDFDPETVIGDGKIETGVEIQADWASVIADFYSEWSAEESKTAGIFSGLRQRLDEFLTLPLEAKLGAIREKLQELADIGFANFQTNLFKIALWLTDITGIDFTNAALGISFGLEGLRAKFQEFVDGPFMKWWRDLGLAWSGLKLAWDELKPAWDELRSALGLTAQEGESSSSLIQQTMGLLGDILISKITRVMETILGLVRNVTMMLNFVRRVMEFFAKIFKKSDEDFEASGEKALGFWTEMWESIVSTAENTWSAIKSFFVRVYAWLFIRWMKIKIAITKWWTETWDAVGNGISTFVTETLPGKWGELTGWLEEKIAEFTTMGNRIVENLVAGISSKIEWAKGQIMGFWQRIRDALPGSEPKDRTSPLYRLGDAGQAMMENVLAGMSGPKIDRLINANLSSLAGGLQAAAAVTNNSARSYNFYDGAIRNSFPNVTNPDDARGIGRVIQDQIDRASAIGHFGGSKRG